MSGKRGNGDGFATKWKAVGMLFKRAVAFAGKLFYFGKSIRVLPLLKLIAGFGCA